MLERHRAKLQPDNRIKGLKNQLGKQQKARGWGSFAAQDARGSKRAGILSGRAHVAGNEPPRAASKWRELFLG